jgi:hypothetical protein
VTLTINPIRRDLEHAISKNAQSVIEYAANRFGPVQSEGFHEIVATDPPIFVHLAHGLGPTDPKTLFTTGMSEMAMPDVPDQEDSIRFAELFIQLPPDWRLDAHAIRDLANAWPILALRELAQMPHQSGRNIGGPIGIVERQGPDDVVAPDASFAGFLLMRDCEIEVEHHEPVSLFRVTPLYWEELQLVHERGVIELFHGFDRCSTPMVVDVHRTNVAV